MTVPLVADNNAIPQASVAGQNPPVAAPNGQAAAQTEDDKRVSTKFSALARKEKIALQKLQAATTKEQAVAAREDALKAREAKMSEFENIRSQNPLKALEMLGLNYNQLSEIMLNEGKVTPDVQIGNLKGEIEAFKKAQEQKAKEDAAAAEKKAIEEQNEIIESFKGDISSFINSQKEIYPLIDLYKQAPLVFNSIDEHYKNTGKIASIKEACDHVEKYLEAEAERALSIEKIRAKVLQQPKAEPKQDMQWGAKQPTKTLSNTMTQTSPTRPPVLTEDERIRRAIDKVWGSR